MAITPAPTAKEKEAARGLRKAAAREESKVEAKTGRDFKKGEQRFEERAKSSDGKSAGSKQKS
ncbi:MULTISPECIES: hypothetical protein [Aminobacter]|uniref:Transcriptional regulator n=1 Tax=Aminobacter ciceronei TaxID=150723 RepID=A0ABR6C0S9_9HYPH|nr:MULTISPECIES: hypothetical protein [Aminobacter]MBA8904447.1 hypothetical protein [Aminobacter ciceronei]MBA9018225.1 hypothetical protein [Aminobacter ciceronei]MRX33119.1 hypothetical protein [Aminobacter sp. MDW-2]QNH36746.1 hypothetical protein H5P29_13090 [Aminobacter sp. MDW-2]